ncbi:hypothetical protein [Streptomyces cylindrosporus]|uniref:Uncharacterized protein n=1 Tax=Streptomyces cylindrosporus TaxID=2927583 RepID=A0ABS9YFH3_9ACTN|nr:hypothetical protein [Streptomyces cylindrosporus]MCI3275974.1 hypothetical protein [Streptomyces cylindrosporus]
MSGPEDRAAGPALEELLAGAMRPEALDTSAEQQAVAAFRAARDTGALKARTRRRDDWRPREQRRTRRSLKVTLSLALAGLTLGGVAYAAIGTGGGSAHDDGHAARQHEHPPTGPSASAPRTPGTSAATPDRPATAKDTAAHCRAYENVKDSGKALQSTAWQRLIEAAGGEQNVAAYCAEQLGEPTATASATKQGNSGKADKSDESDATVKANNGKSAGKGNGKNN